MERKALTCSQCGAPADGERCGYCGAVFGKTVAEQKKPSSAAVDKFNAEVLRKQAEFAARLLDASWIMDAMAMTDCGYVRFF